MTDPILIRRSICESDVQKSCAHFESRRRTASRRAIDDCVKARGLENGPPFYALRRPAGPFTWMPGRLRGLTTPAAVVPVLRT